MPVIAFARGEGRPVPCPQPCPDDPRMSPAEPAFPPVPYATWRARVEAELGEEAERRLRRETLDELVVEPLYAPDHLPASVPLPRVAAGATWRQWQEVRASAGARGRGALAREVERDLGGVWVRADDSTNAAKLATLLGPACAARDVELAIEWEGEPLAAAALLVAAAGFAGVPPERLHGCLGVDPLGALARRGSLAGGADGHLVAAARWASERAPGVRAGLISTAPYADAGADAVQEVAFALATGAEALRRLLSAGLAPDAAATQLLVSVTVGRDLYLQVAKLRALRLTWAMMLAGIGAQPNAPRLHARTAWRTKGRRDPGTDLVRATVETLAALLGGADDVTCTPMLDEDAEAALSLGMALGSATQLVLRDEAGLGRVGDALGGSWYVEALTERVARRAWEIFAGVEERGGMARELAVGGVARQVSEAADRRRRALAEGKLPIVGVTVHASKDVVPLPHRPLAHPPDERPPGPSGAGAVRLAGEPDDPALFGDAIAAAAAEGDCLGMVGAAIPVVGPPLRAPALAPWRDAEPFEAAAEAPR